MLDEPEMAVELTFEHQGYDIPLAPEVIPTPQYFEPVVYFFRDEMLIGQMI